MSCRFAEFSEHNLQLLMFGETDAAEQECVGFRPAPMRLRERLSKETFEIVHALVIRAELVLERRPRNKGGFPGDLCGVAVAPARRKCRVIRDN
jgi:hypothetical protein